MKQQTPFTQKEKNTTKQTKECERLERRKVRTSQKHKRKCTIWKAIYFSWVGVPTVEQC